jgi:tetratricopeptide (TPR) repeat protein
MGFKAQPVAGAAARSLYLQSRSLWNERTPASIREAIRLLERAIVLDGSFALASAALADCFSLLMDYGVLSPRECLTAARLAAGRALHQGPHLAESLTAAALVRQMDLDWEAAETEFLAAIQAHPGYAPARQRYALLLAWMGRHTEARWEIQRALALDPHTPAVSASLAWIDYYAGRFRAAIRTGEEALARHPGFSAARAALASALIQEERPGEAAAVLESALAREAENVSHLSLLSLARGKEGRPKDAEALLDQLRDSGAARYVSPYYLAVPLLGLGREDEALEALERAEAHRSPHLAYLGVEPVFAPLRERQGFRALLERVRVPARNPDAGRSSSEGRPAPTRRQGEGTAEDATSATGHDPREVLA